jgi:[ribosomal protein S5]-alanine N-acetyltransferase
MSRRGTGPPVLETPRLLLRPMTPDDAPEMFAYASDPEVTRYVVWDTHRTPEDSRAFLEATAERYAAGDGLDWGIVHRADGRFIGTCGFVEHSPEHARAEAGFVVSKGYWGRGLAPEALGAMIRFGFEEMGLNRVEARCVAENRASARVMEKAGMAFEGTLRERELVKGAYRDMKVYSALRREWRGRGQPG